jgi:hypothetical protein
LNYGGDAFYYWEESRIITFSEIIDEIGNGSASGFIYLVNYIPSKTLGLSFFVGNIFYALIGFLGFIYLYRIVKQLFPDGDILKNYKFLGLSIFPWILFLPNLHFWSSGVGKDSILFLCISLFIYSIMNLKKRMLGILISVLITLMIRPHITLFLLVSFGIGFILDGKLRMYQKLLILSLFVAGFLSIFNYVMEFIQLENFETVAIEEFASKKADKLNQVSTGSGVDISSYSFPAKIATFLYRPLFFDINGLLAIIVSFENLILLIFTIVILKNNPIKAFLRGDFLIKGILVYFIIGCVAFSLILGNLGIMLRQKNMFIPWILVFGLWTIYSKLINPKKNYENSTGDK